MAVTIKQIESVPATYPDPPEGLSTAAAALDPAMVWSRIESYTAQRWSERSAAWIAEGPGEWSPPLSPATIETVEVWSGANEWEDVTANASPSGGYWLSATGPYRFTGSVGAASPSDVPAPILEAFRRLAEYMASRPGRAGATIERIEAGTVSVAYTRSPSWLAMAMQNSGAADLLRPFRRAA